MLLILALSLVPAEMVPNISFFIVSCIEAGLKVDLSPLFGDRGKLKQAKTKTTNNYGIYVNIMSCSHHIARNACDKFNVK